MSKEAARAFHERLKSDRTLAKEVTDRSANLGAEDLVAIARGAGFDCSFEDLDAVGREIGSEMQDDELDAVSGGTGTMQSVNIGQFGARTTTLTAGMQNLANAATAGQTTTTK